MVASNPVTRSSSHLEAQTAAIEAALVHGGVFAYKALAEAALILEKEVAVAVVMEHALSQVEQGPQLAQGAAVGLHLSGVVGHSKKDAAAVRADVPSFLDDVEQAAAHHLQKPWVGIRQRQSEKQGHVILT